MKTLYPIRHASGKTDKRYSIGLSTYVARFCDKWLGAYHTAEEARAACAEYDESRWLVQA